MANWNRDKIAGLGADQLGKLRANAQRMAAGDVLAWCDEELAIRNVKALRSGRSARPDDERNAEAEAATQLTAFAEGLLAKYDLSAERARLQSQGVKGFRALELLGKNGSAKVGGLQLNGSLSIERYISYRLGADRLILAYALLRDRRVDEARWIVVGPRRLMPDSRLITEQMDGLGDVEKGYVGDFGVVATSFSEASDLFARLIDQIAPARVAKIPTI